MSLQIEIIPNQPLGWQMQGEVSPYECREGTYCSPMLISDNNAWEAYVARALADGATAASPELLACARAESQPFIQAYDSDVFSFQARYTGAVEESCDVKAFITTNEVEATFEGGDGRYKPDTNLFTVEFNYSEEEPASQTATWADVIDGDCEYTASLTITPLPEVVDGAEVTLGGTVIPVANDVPFSTQITFKAGVVDLVLACNDLFKGAIFLSAVDSTCQILPVSLIDAEGEEIGEMSILQNDFVIVGEYTYQSVRAFVTINVNERNGDCYQIKMGGTCCCDDVILSRCVKIIESDENTVAFAYSQAFNGFGFVYSDLWVQHVRLIATWRNPFWNDNEYQDYIDSDGKKNVVYSEPRKGMVLSYQAPDYLHNAMALAVRHDAFRRINEVGSSEFLQMVEGESYSPNWNRDRVIAPIIIELEDKTQNYQSKRC